MEINTEEKIKEATIDLLLREGKFDFTLQEVAEKSNIGRSTIHYYFRSREKLLCYILERIMKDIVFKKYSFLLGKGFQNLKSELLFQSHQKF